MAAGQVAQRYAKGWLSAAKDKNATDSVASDCLSLLAMIEQSADLRAFLASPLVSSVDQVKVVEALAAKAKFHALTTSLLLVLAGARRLNALADVVQAAKDILDAQSGTKQATVTSAAKLDDNKITEIKNQLVKKLGQDVVIQAKVDPAIMGGLVVQIGSTMIDDSVKTKLERLSRRLLEQAA